MPNKDYNSLSKKELLALIEKMQAEKKYGLVWEEDKIIENVVLACSTNEPILTEIKKNKIVSKKNTVDNILIEGDNYHALTVLSKTHKEKIDLIYIDPPYNTGKKEDFMYNDQYVDIDDSYRHSKWLSFMYKRLLLAAKLLHKTGAIFISIDDNEIAQLKLLCNAVFGEENFVAQIIRKNKTGSGHDSGQLAVEFDYMLCYAKNKAHLVFAKEILDVENDTKYKLEDKHIAHRGKYYLRDLDYKGSYSPSLDYKLTVPDGSTILSGNKHGCPNTWRWSKEKVAWGIENDFIVFKNVKDKWKAYIKQYQFVDNENKHRERKLPHRAIISFLNAEGSKELNSIVKQNAFRFPKPTALMLFCINLFANKNLTVLDFFAGSGSTGHAVLKANAEDNGKRKFIICTNNENSICETVTYPRIKKAMIGYEYDNKKVVGLGGNLTYYKTSFKK
jgi:adenine-specific DNA-methyltransferase